MAGSVGQAQQFWAGLLSRSLVDGTAEVLIVELDGTTVGFAELSRGGDIVHLTAAEAGLLAMLAQRAGEPVSREELSQAAPLSGNIRNVDVQMTRLRRKIERDPRYPRYLQTVRGTGYVLKPE